MAWENYKTHRITGSNDFSAGGIADFQMRYTVYAGTGTDSGSVVYLNNACHHWPYDFKFTNAARTVDLSFYVEYSNVSYANVWVKVPSIPKYTDNPNYVDICIVYGDTTQTTALYNGANTFLLFDHFDNGSYNTGIWQTFGTGTVVNEAVGTTHLEITRGSGNGGVRSISSFGPYGVGCRRSIRASSSTIQVQGDFANGSCTQTRFTTTDGQIEYFNFIPNTTTAIQKNSKDKTSYRTLETQWVSSSLCRFSIDDADAATIATNIPSGALQVHVAYLYNAGTAYCDWIFLFKTTTNMPTDGSWSGTSGNTVVSSSSAVGSATGTLSIAGGALAHVVTVKVMDLSNGYTYATTLAEYPVKYDSLQMEKTLGKGGGTSSFTVVDLNHEYRFRTYSMCEVYKDAKKVFLGWITDIEEEPFTPTGSKYHHITLTGTQFMTDRIKGKKVTVENGNQTPSMLLKAASYIDNHTLDAVTYTDSTIPTYADEVKVENFCTRFNTLTDYFDWLCDLDNRFWYIDDYRTFHAYRINEMTPTLTLTDNDMLRGTARLKRSEPKFFTYGQIADTYHWSQSISEASNGNGSRRTFKFAHPISELLELYENGTAVDVTNNVGNKGEPDYDDPEAERRWYYWKEDSSVIIQDTSRPLIMDGQTIRAVYKYDATQDGNLGVESIMWEFRIRSGLSTSYIYHEDNKDRDQKAAHDYLYSLITKYGSAEQYMVTFTTRTATSLSPGMVVYINSTILGLSNEKFLIQSVRQTGNQFDWRYEVECVNQYVTGDWSQYLS
jgi:hypothetical protein